MRDPEFRVRSCAGAPVKSTSSPTQRYLSLVPIPDPRPRRNIALPPIRCNGSFIRTPTLYIDPQLFHVHQAQKNRHVAGFFFLPCSAWLASWSGRQDSNLRLLRPERSALPG